MAAGGTPSNVKLGPGRLWIAPLGTAEPASATAVLPSAWWALGYTETGTELQFNRTTSAVMVAEEFDSIDEVNVSRDILLNVEIAERTKKRLLLVHGGGAAGVDDATAFELPDPETNTGFMAVWDSDKADVPSASNRRRLLRLCKPTGSVTESQARAPQKQTVKASFKVLQPSGVGLTPIKFYPSVNAPLGQA